MHAMIKQIGETPGPEMEWEKLSVEKRQKIYGELRRAGANETLFLTIDDLLKMSLDGNERTTGTTFSTNDLANFLIPEIEKPVD